MNIKTDLVNTILNFKSSKEIDQKVIFDSSSEADLENQFLFFIKPEITEINNSNSLKMVLEMILSKISEYQMDIENISIYSSRFLKSKDIMSRHYGVINKISRNAGLNLSEETKEQLAKKFGEDFSKNELMGSIEFLNKFQEFNAVSLDYLWQNTGNTKVAGGTYCSKVLIDGKDFLLFNGFHPRQLKYFTEDNKCIIVFKLASDLDWEVARNNFVGATNPEIASIGSIRNTLFVNKNAYGLKEVSQGFNGVHLSAGPVEGLSELVRFYFPESDENKNRYLNFKFGKELNHFFSPEQIDRILQNQDSSFDKTELKNSNVAIEVLKKTFLEE